MCVCGSSSLLFLLSKQSLHLCIPMHCGTSFRAAVSLLSSPYAGLRDETEKEMPVKLPASTEPAYLPILSLIHPEVPDNPTQGHVSACRDSNPPIRVERHGSMAGLPSPKPSLLFHKLCLAWHLVPPALALCKIDDESLPIITLDAHATILCLSFDNLDPYAAKCIS